MDCRSGDGEEDSETLHPKVKVELDRLNQASDDINKLENELDEARSKFSSTRNDSTQHLNALARKIKTNVIKKARSYYEANEKARKAQEEALKAARQFQSANGIHRAAKETISLAEQKLCQESGRVLTSEWQEMFNHATIRLMDAEKEKRGSEEEHHTKSQIFSDAEKLMQIEEKKHKRSIARARPYFERKAELQTKLELLKVAVEALQDAVTQSKRKYSEALSNLEAISNQVHEKRKGKLQLYLPREPGVGAETDTTDHPGSLRTSFDVPDTPNSEQMSFDLNGDGDEYDEDSNSTDGSDSCSDVKFNLTSDTNSDDEQTARSVAGGDNSCHRGIPVANPIHLRVRSTKSLSSLDSISEERPNVVGECESAGEETNCNWIDIPDLSKIEISYVENDSEERVINDEVASNINDSEYVCYSESKDSRQSVKHCVVGASKIVSDTTLFVETKKGFQNNSIEIALGDKSSFQGKCISEVEDECCLVKDNNWYNVQALKENKADAQSGKIHDSNNDKLITSLDASGAQSLIGQLQLRRNDINHANADTITLEDIVSKSIEPNPRNDFSGVNVTTEMKEIETFKQDEVFV